MNRVKFLFLYGVVALVCVASIASESQIFSYLPSYVYSFENCQNARFEQVFPSDKSDFLFKNTAFGDPLAGVAGWSASLLNVNESMLLSAQREGMPWEITSWNIRKKGSGAWVSWNDPLLPISLLKNGIYEARAENPTGKSAPFWIAWPVNHAVPDHFLPAGSVHAEIIDRQGGITIRAWGRVYDATQAAANDTGHGVQKAGLYVDTTWVPLTLNDQGAFEVEISLQPRNRGVHMVALYACDTDQHKPRPIDVEYVSEYSAPLVNFVLPDQLPHLSMVVTSHYSQIAIIMTGTIFTVTNYPDARACARPRLDDNGYLVFDGTQSTDTSCYHWSAENLTSGETFSFYGESVSTERLPVGLYEVTLNCRGIAISFYNPIIITNMYTIELPISSSSSKLSVIVNPPPLTNHPPIDGTPLLPGTNIVPIAEPVPTPIPFETNTQTTSSESENAVIGSAASSEDRMERVAVNEAGVDSFYILIPPRLDMWKRKVCGSLHLRWTPEFIDGHWNWSIYVGGYVFDEIGAAVFGSGYDNLEIWATINGQDIGLVKDHHGSFIGRHVIGRRLAKNYYVTLYAKTLDDNRIYEIDSRKESMLSILPPWDRYLK